MARARTWTDEQLREAVTENATWAGVARQLGIKARGSNTRRLRGHAVRLRLDSSHITVRTEASVIDSPEPYGGAPAVNTEELRAAITTSRSWAQVAEKLGEIRVGRSYEKLRRLAASAGIDVSSLYGQRWLAAPVAPLAVPFTQEFDPNRLHRMGTAVATAWFVGRGYMVSIPVEPASYDLIAESDDGLQRVQVKTTCGDAVGVTKVQYGLRSTPSTGKYGGRRPYTTDEIDLFFIYAATGAMYLIPVAAVEGMQRLALSRYSRYRLPGLAERPYSNLAESSG